MNRSRTYGSSNQCRLARRDGWRRGRGLRPGRLAEGGGGCGRARQGCLAAVQRPRRGGSEDRACGRRGIARRRHCQDGQPVERHRDLLPGQWRVPVQRLSQGAAWRHVQAPHRLRHCQAGTGPGQQGGAGPRCTAQYRGHASGGQHETARGAGIRQRVRGDRRQEGPGDSARHGRAAVAGATRGAVDALPGE
jgi:hypothetical protein